PPGGTRSPDGRLCRVKTGMARIALESGVKVYPVAMINTDKVNPIGSWIPRPYRCGVIVGDPIDPADFEDAGDDYQQARALTDRGMWELANLSGQEYVKNFYSADVKNSLAAGQCYPEGSAPGDGVVYSYNTLRSRASTRSLPATETHRGRAEAHWHRGANIKTSSEQTADATVASSASAPASTPRKANRVEWADTAKGLSIIGVCLMHIVTAVPDGTSTPLGLLSSFLDPLRMPLFFLVSGLFAHRVLERTLGDLWYRRLWFLLVPYLVFTPFQALIRLDMA